MSDENEIKVVPLDDPNVPESLVPIPKKTPCDYLGMVKEFHTKYGHFMSDEPQRHDTLPTDIANLRIALIREEAEEFERAQSRVGIADSLADLLYVTFGAALAYGIPIEEIFTEIHRSNMTKSMDKDAKSIPGKTIKGPNYDPPKLVEILLLRRKAR